MTDEEAYQTPYVPTGCEFLSRQLRMARFAMHKNAIHKYVMKMKYWHISREEAEAEYREAMDNFDQILELAVSEPERLVACEEDMARGFHLPSD